MSRLLIPVMNNFFQLIVLVLYFSPVIVWANPGSGAQAVVSSPGSKAEKRQTLSFRSSRTINRFDIGEILVSEGSGKDAIHVQVKFNSSPNVIQSNRTSLR